MLFGSIILYSLANIANGFCHTVDQYALVRFIAGVGLAGELGAGLHWLVSYCQKRKKRNRYFIGCKYWDYRCRSCNILFQKNSIGAYVILLEADWGLLLLLLRISVFEIRHVQSGERNECKSREFFYVF